MKKLTNIHGLPQPLYSAVSNDSYSKGDSDVSITTLLQPPRISALKDLHEDDIQEDAMDRMWSLLGQAVHTILERADDGSEMKEERITIEVLGVRVSGQFDRFNVTDGVVQDYKVTTAYKFKDGLVPLDFQRQLNCYALLLRSKGYEVKKGQVVGILRDWSKREAERNPDYPQKQVVVMDVEIAESEKIMEFLSGRVALWKAAQSVLPECSPEDRWAKPEKYAVMKPGRKRAVRLFDNKNEAGARAGTEGGGAYVEYRPGENVRCDSYCSVAKFCEQYKKLKEKK